MALTLTNGDGEMRRIWQLLIVIVICGGCTTTKNKVKGMAVNTTNKAKEITLSVGQKLNGEDLLPSEHDETSSDFLTYEDAMTAFECIVVDSTNTDELKALGFDLSNGNNIEILTYTDVVSIFLANPNLTVNDIPSGILRCLRAQSGCKAYRYNIRNITERRYGNFFIDVLEFRKRTRTTGWEFNALLVIVDNVVVYSSYSGLPNINKTEVEKNPLGPLNDLKGSDIKKLWDD